MSEIATVNTQLPVVKTINDRFYNNGFMRANDGKPKNSVKVMGIIGRARGVSLVIERTANDEYKDHRLTVPRYAVSVIPKNNEMMESRAGAAFSFYHNTETRFDFSEVLVFIVPKDFAENFHEIMNGEMEYNSSSFVKYLIDVVHVKFDSGQKEVELFSWWKKIKEVYELDPVFPPEDIPVMAKDVESVIKALEMKAELQETEVAEQNEAVRQELEALSTSSKDSTIKKILGDDVEVLEKFKNSSLALTAEKSDSTVSLRNSRQFEVVSNVLCDTVSEPLKIVKVGHGFSLLLETDENKDGTELRYILEHGERNSLTKHDVEENNIHRKAWRNFNTGIGIFLILHAVIAVLTIVTGVESLLLFSVVVSLLAVFLFLPTSLIFKIKALGKNDRNNTCIVDPKDVSKSIILPVEFGNKIAKFMKSNEENAEYTSVLKVLKDKIESKQDTVEIESWLTTVDSFMKVDETFPLDMIPAMSDNAIGVLGSLKEKIAEDACEEMADSESEKAIESDRSKMMMDSMRQDSEAVTEGAMALIGAVGRTLPTEYKEDDKETA